MWYQLPVVPEIRLFSCGTSSRIWRSRRKDEMGAGVGVGWGGGGERKKKCQIFFRIEKNRNFDFLCYVPRTFLHSLWTSRMVESASFRLPGVPTSVLSKATVKDRARYTCADHRFCFKITNFESREHSGRPPTVLFARESR